METILICDDEREIVSALNIYLRAEGWQTVCAYSGKEAVQIAQTQNIHLILMDIMMPEMDGIQAMTEIRKTSNVPVILLTAKSEDSDKILGLNVGADDYITKPFSPREVLARVKAQLRRDTYVNKETSGTENIIKIGELEIDKSAYQIRRAGVDVALTFREFQLVLFLAENAGQVFSREALLQHVWGYEYFGDVRTVDVTVRRTREKLEPDQNNYRYILTKRGVGYYFDKAQ